MLNFLRGTKPGDSAPGPLRSECIFYHSFDFPNGEQIQGHWDIRQHGFAQYIGNYDLSGKTVLDVGTASGYLAFEAEKAGAKHVTALEAESSRDIRHLQFEGHPFHADRENWLTENGEFLRKLKNSFWYAHRRYNSNVEMVYMPLDAVPYFKRTFDVVMAGAIVEHLSDPVTVICDLARLADEALIIAFTPIEDTDDQIMRTANDWTSRDQNFTWWTLSRGLYRRILDNVGFDMEVVKSSALFCQTPDHILGAGRPTIIARRR